MYEVKAEYLEAAKRLFFKEPEYIEKAKTMGITLEGLARNLQKADEMPVLEVVGG